MLKGKPKFKKSVVVANEELKKLTKELISQMPTEKLVTYLTKKQMEVGIDLAQNDESETKISKRHDIDRRTIGEWKRDNPVFIEFIGREIHRIYEEIIATDYGSKEARVNELRKAAHDLKEKIKEVEAIEIFKGRNGVNVTAMAYQTLRKELRDTLKSIAEELGQLEEKLSVTGTILYKSNISHKEKQNG